MILGPVPLEIQGEGIEVTRVTSAHEMFEACMALIKQMDVAVFNAAVSDYTPAEALDKKLKRGAGEWNLSLKPTRDIAAAVGRLKAPGQLLVGFALETDREEENALSKLKKKNLDLMVLNSMRDEGAGFGTDTNRVTMIDRSGNAEKYTLKPKDQVASDLVKRVIKMMDDA